MISLEECPELSHCVAGTASQHGESQSTTVYVLREEMHFLCLTLRNQETLRHSCSLHFFFPSLKELPLGQFFFVVVLFFFLFFKSKQQKVRHKAVSCSPRSHISTHTPRLPMPQLDFRPCLHFPIFIPFLLSQAQGTDLRSSGAFASGENPEQAGRQQWPSASPFPPKSHT